MLDSFIERMKRIHCPNEERPPAEQRRKRADFDARTLIKCLNSTQKAGVLRALKTRIERQIHYQRTYDEVMRRERARVRAVRQSMHSKIMAAVTLGSTSGSVSAYAGFRRMERQNSGNVSATAAPAEAADGARYVWDLCQKDLPIYLTEDGHGVGLREALEMEVLNFKGGGGGGVALAHLNFN